MSIRFNDGSATAAADSMLLHLWNNFFIGPSNAAFMEEGKFNRLSLAERSNIVWQNGKFVDSVICNNYCLMLYSVERQFVELFLDLKTHSIVWISLANDHDLAKYLEDIKIEV